MSTGTENVDALISQAHSLRVLKARRDFPFYCDFVHGRPLYAHQLVWAEELLVAGGKTLIVAPPESLKSSTVRMFIEWSIGRDPDLCVLLVMNTATQAMRQVMSVAETIEKSDVYHEVFPGVVPNKPRGWSHEAIFVRRGNESRPDPTVYGTGIDGPYQGSHVDMLIIDDPTDQQDVRSQATMSSQRDRIRGVLLDRLNEGGRLFTILTRWGEADLMRDFVEMGLSVIENPIEGRYPWGRLLCPELFPDERISRVKAEKGSALYYLTYMCDPGAASGSIIKREWWRRYGDTPEGEPSQMIFSWDLSAGRNERSDFTAYGAWEVYENGYYLVDAGHWRLTMDELIRKMELLYAVHRPKWLLVEDVGTSVPVVDYIKQHTRLPIRPVIPGRLGRKSGIVRDKEARLMGVVHLIEAGRVWLPASASWVEEFIDECAAFPGGQHDDQVDQMTQALEYMELHSAVGAIDMNNPPRYPSFAGGGMMRQTAESTPYRYRRFS